MDFFFNLKEVIVWLLLFVCLC